MILLLLAANLYEIKFSHYNAKLDNKEVKKINMKILKQKPTFYHQLDTLETIKTGNIWVKPKITI